MRLFSPTPERLGRNLLKQSAGRTVRMAHFNRAAAKVEMIPAHYIDIYGVLGLIAAGARADMTDGGGRTALMNVLKNSCGGVDVETIMHELIAKGTPLDTVDKNGWTALMYAVEQDRLDLARILIATGAKTELQNLPGCKGWSVIPAGRMTQVAALVEKIKGPARLYEDAQERKKFDDWCAEGMPLTKDLGLIEPLKYRAVKRGI